MFIVIFAVFDRPTIFFHSFGVCVQLGCGTDDAAVFRKRKLRRYRKREEISATAAAVTDQLIQILVKHMITSDVIVGESVEKYTEAGEKSVFFVDFIRNELSKIYKKIGKFKSVLEFMAKMQKFRIPIDKIPFTWYDYSWLVGANQKRNCGRCPFIL